MKDERMMILGMIEKGIINSEEAERLLLALQGSNKDGVNAAVGNALNRAGNALGHLSKALGQKAEDLSPKVKDAAEKMSEKAGEVLEEARETYNSKMEPKIKKAAEKMTDKATELIDDAKTYAEKRKAKKAANEDDGIFMDVEDFDENEVKEVLDYLNEDEEEDELPQHEDEDTALLAKKLQELNDISTQLGILDDAEAFLKGMGNIDEDEEETKKQD